jgi:undecaprenyl-diphosphatase
MKDLNIKDALIIGTVQGIAVLPGISRSGSTLFASIKRRLKLEEALKFSFLLAIPAILGANALSLIKNFEKAMVIKGDLALGLIISCIFGIISISMLRYILKKSRL